MCTNLAKHRSVVYATVEKVKVSYLYITMGIIPVTILALTNNQTDYLKSTTAITAFGANTITNYIQTTTTTTTTATTTFIISIAIIITTTATTTPCIVLKK